MEKIPRHIDIDYSKYAPDIPEDVLELMLAGATAVEVGAANLVDPFACRDLVNDLPRVMEHYHIKNLNDIIGGAHHG